MSVPVYSCIALRQSESALWYFLSCCHDDVDYRQTNSHAGLEGGIQIDGSDDQRA